MKTETKLHSQGQQTTPAPDFIDTSQNWKLMLHLTWISAWDTFPQNGNILMQIMIVQPENNESHVSQRWNSPHNGGSFRCLLPALCPQGIVLVFINDFERVVSLYHSILSCETNGQWVNTTLSPVSFYTSYTNLTGRHCRANIYTTAPVIV